MDQDSVISVDSAKPLERLKEDFVAACAHHKFGVLGTIDLRAKMKDKGVEFGSDVVVFEVCNPHHAKTALTADLRISAALPCRVSAFPAGSGTRLTTIRPRMMLDAFGAKSVEPVAQEVERVLVAIMQEAAK